LHIGDSIDDDDVDNKMEKLWKMNQKHIVLMMVGKRTEGEDLMVT
jgi:hypothetical protein